MLFSVLLVALCLAGGVYHACATARLTQLGRSLPVEGSVQPRGDHSSKISTSSLVKKSMTDVVSMVPSAAPTASPTASNYYHFSAFQVLAGVSYDTYMSSRSINDFIVMTSIADGLSLPSLTIPAETLVFSPDNIVIYECRGVLGYVSIYNSTEIEVHNNMLISYYVNYNLAAMAGYAWAGAFSSLSSQLSTYATNQSASGFGAVLRSNAATYNAVNLKNVTCDTFGADSTYTAGLGGSTDSSSDSDATTINGLIAGLTIALFLFFVATAIAVYYFSKSLSGSTSPTPILVQAIEMKV